MNNELIIQMDNGNSQTTTVIDSELSPYFWNDYYSTNCYLDDDEFFFESNIDLMGNPKKPEYEHA